MKSNFKYYVDTIIEQWNYYIIPAMMFFLPAKGLLIAIGLFVLFDTVTGIAAAKKTGVLFKSRKLFNFVYKTLIYQMVILLTFITDQLILGEIVTIFFEIENLSTKVVTLVLIFIEATSINENLEKVYGQNLWTSFLRLITGGKDVLKKIRSDVEPEEKPKKDNEEGSNQ